MQSTLTSERLPSHTAILLLPPKKWKLQMLLSQAAIALGERTEMCSSVRLTEICSGGNLREEDRRRDSALSASQKQL